MLHMGNNPMLHIWATASKRRWTVAGSTQYDTTGPWKGWGTKREVQIFLKLQLVMYIANTKRDIANTKMHITNTKRGVDSSKKDTPGNDMRRRCRFGLHTFLVLWIQKKLQEKEGHG